MAQDVTASVTRQSTRRCSAQIAALASADVTFKVPSKPRGLRFPVPEMQVPLLTVYVQEHKADGLGSEAPPPASRPGHHSQRHLTRAGQAGPPGWLPQSEAQNCRERAL